MKFLLRGMNYFFIKSIYCLFICLLFILLCFFGYFDYDGENSVPTAVTANAFDDALIANEVKVRYALLAQTSQTVEFPAFVRVREKNVYFCSTPSDDSKLFALTPTYYLRVLGREGNFFRVEIMEESQNFAKLIGYVAVSAVEEINEEPLLPLYPTQVLSVTSSSARVYLQPSLSAKTLITATNSQQVGYYGKLISSGIEWYYVFYGEQLGYVNSEYLSMPSISPHPTPLSVLAVDVVIEPEIDEPEPIADDSSATDSPLLSQPTLGILIALIIIPTVVIVVLLFTPERKPRKVKELSFVDLTTADKTQAKPRYFDDYI